MPHVSWVVPIHNQSKNIPRIMYGFASQTRMPDSMVFVTDKCTDNSFDMLKVHAVNLCSRGVKVTITGTDPKRGFGAGMTRDTGLLVAESEYDPDLVVFTDGDCIPEPNLVESHIEAHNSLSGPVVCCGARTDIEEDGSVSADPRLRNEYNKNKVFSPTTTRYVINPDVIVSSWACWSCNMSVNKAAIARCRDINSFLAGSEQSRVFSPVFDGRWGGEDGFVAMSLFYSGGHVLMLKPDAYVTHIWHPRSHTNIEHLFLLKAKLVELRSLCRDLFEPDAEFSGSLLNGYDGQSWIGVGEGSSITAFKLSSRLRLVLDQLLANLPVSKTSQARLNAVAYVLARNPKMVYTGGYITAGMGDENEAQAAYLEIQTVRDRINNYIFVPVREREDMELILPIEVLSEDSIGIENNEVK